MDLFQFLRHNVDERFLLHRYKSTSHAGILAALLMATWFWYDWVANGVKRYDFLTVLCSMAVFKILFMTWYHFRD
jgi:hypothetical protein